MAPLLAMGCVLPTAAQTSGAIGDTLRNNSLKASGPGEARADLNVNAYETDNARRTASDTLTDTVMSVGMAVDTSRTGTRLDCAVAGDVNYLKYARDTYKGEVFGFLDGNAKFAFVPERIDWIVRESFNRLLVDPTVSATPQNLESYNYITTGPRFLLHFGSSAELMVQGLYSILNSISSANTTGVAVDLDSKRYGGTASLSYRASESGRFSLNFNTERVRYNNKALDADFDRSEISLGYDMKIARTTFAAEVGDTRITQRGESSNGLLTRIGVTRKVSPASRVELSFARQTADAADIIRYDFGAIRPDETPLRVAAHDPLVDTTATLGGRFERPRTEFSADVYRTQERYTVSSTLNRDVTGAHVTFERRLQPHLSVAVSGRFERQTFGRSSLSDNEYNVSAALNWYVGRWLWVSFRGDHFDRHGLQGNSLAYTENRIGVRVSYSLLRRRRPS